MPHALSETGTTLDDKYILLGEIQSNELYSLYRAEHLRLGGRVFIQLGKGPDQRQAALAAAGAVGQIHHDNVWRVLDSGTAPSGAPYVAMTALEGETLHRHVKRSGPLDESEALDVIRQLLSGLAACHDARLLHGRLSPHTVWVTVNEVGRTTVKLYGFGLASGAPSARHWLAPEATLPNFDERADLYSVAGILLTLLGGNPNPPKPTLPSGLGSALTTIVLRGLAAERAERPATARDFLLALEESEVQTEAPASSAAVSIVKRRRQRPAALKGVSDSLLLAPRIPPAAPAPLFDSRDATFSTSDLVEQSRALSKADTRKKTLQATLIGVLIGLLVAWVSGLL